MLTRDNVLHVKWPNQGESFGQQAVFAAQAGPTPDGITQGSVPQNFRDLRRRRALDWKMAIRSPPRT
jgi:hypothetical protein